MTQGQELDKDSEGHCVNSRKISHQVYRQRPETSVRMYQNNKNKIENGHEDKHAVKKNITE